MSTLTEIRNELYDKIPSGQIDAFELIKIISAHLVKLDAYIDNSPDKQLRETLQWILDLKRSEFSFEEMADKIEKALNNSK